MTDTTVTRYPATPAEVAAAILDKIEQYPETFDMDTWVNFGPDDGGALLAATAPACGTTLCAAGWAAHVTGWTLKYDFTRPEVTVRDEHGEHPVRIQLFAQKGDERRIIEDVAADALGLKPGQSTFWFTDRDTALHRLREIAGR